MERSLYKCPIPGRWQQRSPVLCRSDFYTHTQQAYSRRFPFFSFNSGRRCDQPPESFICAAAAAVAASEKCSWQMLTVAFSFWPREKKHKHRQCRRTHIRDIQQLLSSRPALMCDILFKKKKKKQDQCDAHGAIQSQILTQTGHLKRHPLFSFFIFPYGEMRKGISVDFRLMWCCIQIKIDSSTAAFLSHFVTMHRGGLDPWALHVHNARRITAIQP
jgi:hypothetical protein